MFHSITLLGYVGKSPEMRYTPSGTALTNFSVATTEKWKDAQGEKQEKTTWFRVTAWRKLAEICNQYVSKGDLVYIIGTLQSDGKGNPKTFLRNDGSSGASFEINAQTVKFCGKRGQQEHGQDAPQEPREPVNENDIPF